MGQKKISITELLRTEALDGVVVEVGGVVLSYSALPIPGDHSTEYLASGFIEDEDGGIIIFRSRFHYHLGLDKIAILDLSVRTKRRISMRANYSAGGEPSLEGFECKYNNYSSLGWDKIIK